MQLQRAGEGPTRCKLAISQQGGLVPMQADYLPQWIPHSTNPNKHWPSISGHRPQVALAVTALRGGVKNRLSGDDSGANRSVVKPHVLISTSTQTVSSPSALYILPSLTSSSYALSLVLVFFSFVPNMTSVSRVSMIYETHDINTSLFRILKEGHNIFSLWY